MHNLVILSIIFRIIRSVGLKTKKELRKTENPKQKFSIYKNHHLPYSLTSLAFIFTLAGLMTMSSTGQESHVADLEGVISSYMGKIIPTFDDFRNVLNDF